MYFVVFNVIPLGCCEFGYRSGTVDCLERLVSKKTYSLSHGTLKPVYLLTYLLDICLMKYGSRYGWIGTIELRQYYKITII